MIGKWCRKSSQRDGTSTISNVHWLYGVLFVFKRPTQFARAMMERRLVVFYWLADTSSSALAGHPPRNRPVDWLCRKARAFPRVPAPTQPTDNPCRSRTWLVETGKRLPLAKQVIPLRRNFGKFGCMRWACVVLIGNFTPKGFHASAEVGDLVCNFALSFLSALEGAERLYFLPLGMFLDGRWILDPQKQLGSKPR